MDRPMDRPVVDVSWRVLTWNIRTAWAVSDGRDWWPWRRAALAAAIAAERPDVVCLQEVRPSALRWLRRHLPGYALAASVGREDGVARGEHASVLHRVGGPIPVRTSARWLSPTPHTAGSVGWDEPGPRLATLVWFDDPSGGPSFAVANAHLAVAPQARAHGAGLLAGWVADEPDVPWIVTGDLNATWDDPALRWSLGAVLADALITVPTSGEGAATAHRFTGTTTGRRIDHVLHTRHWTVERGGILHPRTASGRPASDHWPVVATLTLS